jgi:hypothetical protein
MNAGKDDVFRLTGPTSGSDPQSASRTPGRHGQVCCIVRLGDDQGWIDSVVAAPLQGVVPATRRDSAGLTPEPRRMRRLAWIADIRSKEFVSDVKDASRRNQKRSRRRQTGKAAAATFLSCEANSQATDGQRSGLRSQTFSDRWLEGLPTDTGSLPSLAFNVDKRRNIFGSAGFDLCDRSQAFWQRWRSLLRSITKFLRMLAMGQAIAGFSKRQPGQPV